jgi:hypothetical protein
MLIEKWNELEKEDAISLGDKITMLEHKKEYSKSRVVAKEFVKEVQKSEEEFDMIASLFMLTHSSMTYDDINELMMECKDKPLNMMFLDKIKEFTLKEIESNIVSFDEKLIFTFNFIHQSFPKLIQFNGVFLNTNSEDLYSVVSILKTYESNKDSSKPAIEFDFNLGDSNVPFSQKGQLKDSILVFITPNERYAIKASTISIYI